MKVKDLSIGQTLFSYNDWQLFEYQVIEKQILETREHKEQYWILESKCCTHGKACQIATKLDDYGNLTYSHMVNQYEEEYNDSSRCKNNHFHWHTNPVFFATKKDARIFAYNRSIKANEDRIKELEEQIEGGKIIIKQEKDKLLAITEED